MGGRGPDRKGALHMAKRQHGTSNNSTIFLNRDDSENNRLASTIVSYYRYCIALFGVFLI